MSDVLNPDHYRQGDIECIDSVRAQLTPEEFRGHCKAAAQEYVYRERMKGGDDSIRKAIWFLRMAIGDDPREDRGTVLGRSTVQDVEDAAKRWTNPDARVFVGEDKVETDDSVTGSCFHCKYETTGNIYHPCWYCHSKPSKPAWTPK